MSGKLSKNITFEEALLELESITRSLEDGKESLENSMELYEKGILLKNFCETKLKEAEGKWAVLKKNGPGSYKSQPLDKETFFEKEKNEKSQENMF